MKQGPRAISTKSRYRQKRALYALLSLLSVAGGILLWWGAVTIGLANPILMPPPQAVAKAVVDMIADGTLLEHIGVSVGRALGGFFLAALIGVPLGIIVGRLEWAYALVEPWLEIFRPIPPIAVLPIIVLWFGIGELSKLIVVCYGAFFPILINTVHGVRSVDNVLIRAARALGAAPRQIFYMVILPAAVPSIVTGLRLGAGMAIFVLVAAELLGSTSGLGWLIMDSRERFNVDGMMVGIVALGVVGYFINVGLVALERTLARWRPAQER